MSAALGPLPLGGTESGARWCRKALHPADSSIASAPVPGSSKVPTVSSHYTQVLQLEPLALTDPDDHLTSWDAEIFIREDPVVPVSITLRSNGETTTSTTSFSWLNTTVSDYVPHPVASDYQAPSATMVSNAYAAFRRGKNFYRMTHAGLTVQHVCSSTTNQGTIISAQYAASPVTRCMAGYPITYAASDGRAMGVLNSDTSTSHYPVQTAGENATVTYFLIDKVRLYPEPPRPEASLLQATHGYTGPAKDGLYIPLKLSHPQKMINVDQLYILGDAQPDTATLKGVWSQRSSTGLSTSGWPYFYGHEIDRFGNLVLIRANKECGSTVSHSIIRGLDPHATLRLFLRVGIEFVPETSSEYAAFARAVPPPDTVALKMYQEIAAALKDAYTRDYNDSSRLLQVISSAARRILPTINRGLSAFARVPGFTGDLARGLSTLTSAFLTPAARNPSKSSRTKTRSNRKKKKTGPKAAKAGVISVTVTKPDGTTKKVA